MANSQNPAQELNALRQIILGSDIDALRNSLTETEATIASQLATTRDEVAKVVTQLKSEMAREIKTIGHTVFEEGKKRVEAVEAVENKLADIGKDIESQIAARMPQTSIEDVEARVASSIADVERKVEGLRDEIDSVKELIETLKLQSTKVSGVLQNFAQIIAGTAAASQMTQAAPAEAPAPKAKPQARPAAAPAPQAPKPQAQPAAAPRPAAAPQPQAPSPDPFMQAQSTQQNVANAGDLPGSDDFLKNIDEIFKLGT